MPPAPASPRRHDSDERDQAIDRVRRTTRWVVASAVVGTGALVGVVAHELPAHSTAHTSTGTSSGTSGASTSSGGTSSGTGTSAGSAGSSGSTTRSATSGTTTGSSSTSGASVSRGSQPAHAVTGQS